MGTFNGKVVVMTANGTAFSAMADLQSQAGGAGMIGWQGSLFPDDATHAFGLSGGRLRLTNGAEADFICDDYRVEMSKGLHRATLIISGQGQPPF